MNLSFEYDAALDLWITEAEFLGHKIKVQDFGVAAASRRRTAG